MLTECSSLYFAKYLYFFFPYEFSWKRDLTSEFAYDLRVWFIKTKLNADTFGHISQLLLMQQYSSIGSKMTLLLEISWVINSSVGYNMDV